MPGRHSLLWRLAGLLVLFGLLIVTLQTDIGHKLIEMNSRLPAEAKSTLRELAREAESAWQQQGREGVDDFLRRLREREDVWAVVVDEQRQSLSSRALDEMERRRLDFIRPLDGMLGNPRKWPVFYVPFGNGEARLVVELPRRLNPRKHLPLWEAVLQYVLPVFLAILLGYLLYRMLIAPLAILRRQASALSAGDLGARVGEPVCARRDELGELGRAFDHMAGRLESTVAFQRQLLRDLSHELRTPLSRLRVAGENETDIEALRQRLDRELQTMERLVADTLELVWLDTERPRLPLEPVEVGRLWEVLREDACFESGWSEEHLPCDLEDDCLVRGHLNGLAQALENILRNAIRHSPEDGVVRLSGCRDGQYWHLWIDDQGPGVDDQALESIFQPFTRLNAARPGGDGFGLGLSIARSMVRLQGGELWAENLSPGLRMNIRLHAV